MCRRTLGKPRSVRHRGVGKCTVKKAYRVAVSGEERAIPYRTSFRTCCCKRTARICGYHIVDIPISTALYVQGVEVFNNYFFGRTMIIRRFVARICPHLHVQRGAGVDVGGVLECSRVEGTGEWDVGMKVWWLVRWI